MYKLNVNLNKNYKTIVKIHQKLEGQSILYER